MNYFPCNYLFRESVDELDVSTRHRLLLVGKILQNLANFVEFGQKQPHLTAMNTFLKNNKFRMEILVELISVRRLFVWMHVKIVSHRSWPQSKSSEKKRVLGQGEIDKNRTAQLCAAMVHHLDQQSAIDGAWMLQSKGRDLARVLDLIHLKMGQACKSLHFVGLKKDLIKRSESVGSQMSVSQNIPRTTSPEPIVRSG